MTVCLSSPCSWSTVGSMPSSTVGTVLMMVPVLRRGDCGCSAMEDEERLPRAEVPRAMAIISSSCSSMFSLFSSNSSSSSSSKSTSLSRAGLARLTARLQSPNWDPRLRSRSPHPLRFMAPMSWASRGSLRGVFISFVGSATLNGVLTFGVLGPETSASGREMSDTRGQ